MNSLRGRKRKLFVEAESLREVDPNEIEPFWTPFALRTTALVLMLVYTTVMFVAVIALSQILARVQKGAVVSACSSSRVNMHMLSSHGNGDSNCPRNDTGLNIRKSWSELPALPRFSEQGGRGADFSMSLPWFLTSFGPSIAAVIYSIFWNIIDITVKKLHPFMEMARDERTTTGSKICFTYLDKTSLLVPYYAYRNHDRLVLVVSLLDVTASIILVPLIVGCFELQIFLAMADGGTYGRSPALRSSFVYSAAAVLGFIMVGILYLIWNLRMQTSGVYSDPSSLASIFGMAHPSVLRKMRAMDFEVISGSLSSTQLHKKLCMLEPRLAHIVDVSGSTKYQIVINTIPEQSIQPPIKGRSSGWLQKFRGSIAVDLLPLVVVTGAFGITSFSEIINPSTAEFTTPKAKVFWSKEGISALAVLMKIFWTTIERETRLLEPLRRLASEGAKKNGTSAARSILPPLESNPFTAMFHSTILFLFALAGAATEVLTMLIGPGLSSQSLYTELDGSIRALGNDDSYWVLMFIRIAGLVIVILGIFVLGGYRETSPKVPDGYGIRTVADTLRLVCASQCVEDFAQVSMLGQEERDETVLGWKERYAFGMIRGGDGVERWGVDFKRFILSDQTLED